MNKFPIIIFACTLLICSTVVSCHFNTPVVALISYIVAFIIVSQSV